MGILGGEGRNVRMKWTVMWQANKKGGFASLLKLFGYFPCSKFLFFILYDS